ncbi:MAG TPA: PIN domain-containing protein [Vicinamibacterales bacterium]|nr:PIN domain-containing protein [Vicinamibacterales bacterium]
MSKTRRTFAVDTNCIVAALSPLHMHHRAALAECGRRLDRGEHMVVPASALIEAYAVLTRLPMPQRLEPSDAMTLLDANFLKQGQVVGTDPARVPDLLRLFVDSGVAGGRTYDALIAEAAREAGADVILTFNRRHFEPAPHGVAVVEPADDPPGGGA